MTLPYGDKLAVALFTYHSPVALAFNRIPDLIHTLCVFMWFSIVIHWCFICWWQQWIM